MKIVIAGGTGQIGMILSRALAAEGHEIVILSRHQSKSPYTIITWDAKSQGPWSKEIEGSDVVINLAGRSVNCRYTATNRKEIIDSRVDSTRAIGKAIANATHPPRVWLQSSTATIYAHRYDEPNDEYSGILGGKELGLPDTWRFSINVAKAWEEAAKDIETPQTRKILMRSAMVMSPDAGGVFDVMRSLVKKGLGGTNGDGRQFVSWIHEVDFVNAIRWLIDHDEIDGEVNLASPNPLPNAEFMRTLRQANGTTLGLPAMNWMLEIGAFFMRTETELILKSRRVVPGRLLHAGFEFQFAEWKEAAKELCKRLPSQTSTVRVLPSPTVSARM